MVARLTPDRKVGCSRHSEVIHFYFLLIIMKDPRLYLYSLIANIIVFCTLPFLFRWPSSFFHQWAHFLELGLPSYTHIILPIICLHNLTYICLDLRMALWRNGSASDSRSDGWVFESLWGHLFFHFFTNTIGWTGSVYSETLLLI